MKMRGDGKVLTKFLKAFNQLSPCNFLFIILKLRIILVNMEIQFAKIIPAAP